MGIGYGSEDGGFHAVGGVSSYFGPESGGWGALEDDEDEVEDVVGCGG